MASGGSIGSARRLKSWWRRISRIEATQSSLARNPQVEVAGRSYFEFEERIQVSGRVYVGPGAFWSAKGGIELGHNVIFGPRTVLWSYNHNHLSQRFLPYGPPEEDLLRPIIVQDNVWVGLGAMVLAGVTLGEGCVIGAGAVVPADVPCHCVAVGNPARVVGQRDEATYRRLLSERAFWLDYRARVR